MNCREEETQGEGKGGDPHREADQGMPEPIADPSVRRIRGEVMEDNVADHHHAKESRGQGKGAEGYSRREQ